MRQSGIFMHITSLPGPYGVGTMGREAYEFVDFLERAGQHLWQILPLTPTGYGDSPYQSCSTFAGNHYLIDLRELIRQGLLTSEEVESYAWQDTDRRVNFGLLYQNRLTVLHKAFSRFDGGEGFERFCREQNHWLSDYSLYMALKDMFDGAPWYDWEDGAKFRHDQVLAQYREKLGEDIRFYSFLQYVFYHQWQALRSYAHDHGVRIIGDVPIYVPYDSVEVWSNPELFYLDENLTPVEVAGCPPDYFSEDGQLWGNPLYRWDVHKAQNFDWWIRRMKGAAERYDKMRLDHFRGFEAYWSVPYGDATARNGKWVKGPDMDFVRILKEHFPQDMMIAEDLGTLTVEVRNMHAASGYPGMKVLEFAFDSEGVSEHQPHTYCENSVCYTGTHDNMTTRQWLQTASAETLARAKAYMGLNESEGYVWGVIRTALASVSETCIIPMQDYLELGEEGRMNFPGTQSERNWTWRASADYLTEQLAQKIYRMTRIYGRI